MNLSSAVFFRDLCTVLQFSDMYVFLYTVIKCHRGYNKFNSEEEYNTIVSFFAAVFIKN